MSSILAEERLIIVPDDDDDDDDDEDEGEIEELRCFDIAKTTTIANESSNKDKQSTIQTRDIFDFDADESESFIPSKPKAPSKPTVRLLKKSTSKSKLSRTKSSLISAASSSSPNAFYVTFDNISNILTIARMGSVYYSVEDLYSKIFVSLCTLDQFVDFLTRPQHFALKQATLSERLFVTQHNPRVKSYASTRYRLIPFAMSDCLLKLKQLLAEYPLHEICSQLEIYLCNKKNAKTILSQPKRSSPSKNSTSPHSTERPSFKRAFSSPSSSMPMIVHVEENVQSDSPSTPATMRIENTQTKKQSASDEQTAQTQLQPSNPSQRSISLSQAILEHRESNFDALPKLVVRHRKSYATKMIEIMGQLFPTWFVSPTSRCIHCFTCDQVYTPQLFMLHTDEKQFLNEKPLKTTSIQLLASEQLSESKVKLWNDFCEHFTSLSK